MRTLPPDLVVWSYLLWHVCLSPSICFCIGSTSFHKFILLRHFHWCSVSSTVKRGAVPSLAGVIVVRERRLHILQFLFDQKLLWKRWRWWKQGSSPHLHCIWHSLGEPRLFHFGVRVYVLVNQIFGEIFTVLWVLLYLNIHYRMCIFSCILCPFSMMSIVLHALPVQWSSFLCINRQYILCINHFSNLLHDFFRKSTAYLLNYSWRN